MDVAARGMRRGAVGENRYYHIANRGNTPSHDNASSQEAKNPHLTIKMEFPKKPAETKLPPSGSISFPKSTHQTRSSDHSGSDVGVSGLESEPELNSVDHIGIADRGISSSDENPSTQTTQLDAGFFDKQPQASKDSKLQPSGRFRDSKLLTFRRGARSHRGNSGDEVEDEMGEIDLHRWYGRGAVVLEAPWFRSNIEA
ncbi:hypothetical protein MMC29_001880 [Sticta canariensis]|nr:hypothetical protein [Sticta canariensis]